MPLVGNPSAWKADSKQAVIRDALDNTMALVHQGTDCAGLRVGRDRSQASDRHVADGLPH
jgi:hypothetical protein